MKSRTGKKANALKVLQGVREDDSVQEKEYVVAFVPPEWQPHRVPPIFDVSFNASQSLILDWGVKDLWSTSPFLKKFFYFIYLFIVGCVGSSFLCEGFL